MLTGRVAPYTRGWSRPVGGLPSGDRGCPVHAGMVRPAAPWPPSPRRLPRTRGDGPLHLIFDAIYGVIAPYTRGWSVAADQLHADWEGCPVHAGMVPTCGWPTQWRPRLPRTRGDGPACRAMAAVAKEVAPYTRGWSTPPDLRRHLRRDCPVHAGMVLMVSADGRALPGLPRTRGDGPSSRSACVDCPKVAPVHAGMVPIAYTRVSNGNRLPRTRGDGPVKGRLMSDIR